MILTGPYKEYQFYNDSETLRYYPDPIHAYFKKNGDELQKLDGVTTVCHIIDKSPALVPWSAKMMYEKLLRIIPTVCQNGVELLAPLSFEEFTAFAADAKNAHKDKLEEAGNVGTKAHAWLEEYIKRCLGIIEEGFLSWPDDERAKSCVTAALTWMERHNVRWVHTERKIYSRQYAYAGTLDGIAVCDSCDNHKCCPTQFKDRLSVIDWKSSNYLYTEYLYQTAAYQQAYVEETGENIEDRWIVRLGKEDGKFDPWHCEEDAYEQDWSGFKEAMDLSRTHYAVEARMKAKRDAIREESKRERAIEKEAEKAAKDEAKAIIKAEKAAAKEAEKVRKAEEKAALKLQKQIDKQNKPC